MGRALARGFVTAGLTVGNQVSTADPLAAAREDFCRTVPEAQALASAVDVVANSDVVFLCVKPQQMKDVMRDVRPAVTAEKLIVSIAAGVTLRTLAEGLASERVVRVMPNTPCLIGQCAAAYCLAGGASDDDGRLVGRLLRSVGVAFELDEKLLDAVTGLSGSGPAFVYVIIEALSDGGVRMGLPRDVATALAAQTVRGAAEMVLTGGEHPAVLKDRVASPGGTTIAGLTQMEQGGLRGTLIAAVTAATRRATELGG